MVAVQLAPAATSPQLLVWLYLVLDIVACMNVTLALVLLVKVTVCVRDVALNVSALALIEMPLVLVPPVPVDPLPVPPVPVDPLPVLLPVLVVVVFGVLPFTADPGEAATPNFIAGAPAPAAPTSGALPM